MAGVTAKGENMPLPVMRTLVPTVPDSKYTRVKGEAQNQLVDRKRKGEGQGSFAELESATAKGGVCFTRPNEIFSTEVDRDTVGKVVTT